MSEIEQMYEKVGVKKGWNSTPYGGIEEYYPQFTAEKQIELIKWLIDTDYFITEFYRLIYTREYYIKTNYKHFQSSSFEESLAGLINSLWQSLTPEEKQQVKGILE